MHRRVTTPRRSVPESRDRRHAVGDVMSGAELARFLTDLATDPGQLAGFLADPALSAGVRLCPEDAATILNGDLPALYGRLQPAPTRPAAPAGLWRITWTPFTPPLALIRSLPAAAWTAGAAVPGGRRTDDAAV